MDTYSMCEARNRFSEIIRKVRAGRRLIVTHHGTPVAEIRPVDTAPVGLEARLNQLECQGIVQPPVNWALTSHRLVRRRRALTRFLGSRD